MQFLNTVRKAEHSFVVWLKPSRSIAAKFIFLPSKVSIYFTMCCLLIVVVFNFPRV